MTPSHWPAPRLERAWPLPPGIGAGLDPAAGDLYSGAGVQAGVVGELSHVQLLNPENSNVRIVIEQIVTTSAAQTTTFLRRSRTLLTTLSDRWRTPAGRGVVGVAELRTQSNVTQIGTEYGRVLTAAFVDVTHALGRVVLDPGESLIVALDGANTSLVTWFRGRELTR